MLIAEVSEGEWMVSWAWEEGCCLPTPLPLGHSFLLLLLGHLSPCTSHWLPWVPEKDKQA